MKAAATETAHKSFDYFNTLVHFLTMSKESDKHCSKSNTKVTSKYFSLTDGFTLEEILNSIVSNIFHFTTIQCQSSKLGIQSFPVFKHRTSVGDIDKFTFRYSLIIQYMGVNFSVWVYFTILSPLPLLLQSFFQRNQSLVN